jgi:hypothetical protein
MIEFIGHMAFIFHDRSSYLSDLEIGLLQDLFEEFYKIKLQCFIYGILDPATPMEYYYSRNIISWCNGFMEHALSTKLWQEYADDETLKEIAAPILNICSYACGKLDPDLPDEFIGTIEAIKPAIYAVNDFFKTKKSSC